MNNSAPAPIIRLLVCVAALVTVTSVHAQDPWPTKHFELVFGKPQWPDETERPAQIEVVPLTEAEFDALTISAAQIIELENFLHDAAEKLIEWRFPPPNLPVHAPIAGVRGGPQQVYRVYVYPFGNELGGAYWGECGERHLRMRTYAHFGINADDWTNDDGEGPEGMSRRQLNTAMLIGAHEMFHTIQGNTVGENAGCKFPPWIDEGTADAIGYDLVRLIKGQVRFDSPYSDIDEIHGLRRFWVPLDFYKTTPLGEGTEAYRTSSFWRYLAERNAAVVNGRKLPGAGWNEPDYTYLAAMYEDPDTYPDSENSHEHFIKWLDYNLKEVTSIGVGLDRILPDFYSVFAGYPTTRSKRADAADWLKTQCEYDVDRMLLLDRLLRSVSVEAVIEPRSAICFSVERDSYLLPQALSVTITLDIKSKAEGVVLSLGEAGGKRVMHGTLSGGCPKSGPCKVSWTWQLEPNTPKVFVLTAVAPNEPESHAHVDAAITITTGGMDGNFDGPPSRNRKSGKRSTDGTPTAREAMEQDGLELKKDGVFTGSLSRPMDGSGQMEISITTTAGYADVIGSTTGVGGVLQQALTNGALMGEFMQEIMAAELLLERDLETRDGAQISIRLPEVDYGFTGEIEGALIRVSRAGGGSLSTIGPKDIDPAVALERFPASGVVTIDEYTPEMMRGSFSGVLVERRTREQRLRDNNRGVKQPVLKSIRSISGSFWISAPWQSDERYESFVDEAMLERIGTDITELFRGFHNLDDTRPQGIPPSPNGEETQDLIDMLAGGNTGGEGASALGNCSCTCDEYEKLEKFGEDLERASEAEDTDRFMELSQQFTMTTMCFSVCMKQYEACY